MLQRLGSFGCAALDFGV